MAKKMLLVPADSLLERIPPLPPYQHQMNVLDSEMRNILDNKTLLPEMKMKLFYNTLRQHGLVEQNTTNPDYVYRPPVAPTTPEPTPEMETGKELPVSDAQILQQVPTYSRKNARLLLSYLKRNPDISWNEAKEMVYKGERIPLSNIYDLVTDISRDRKKQNPAIGWKEFTSSLMKQNIPRTAVANTQRWQYMMMKEAGIPEEEDQPITHDLRGRKIVAGRIQKRKKKGAEPIIRSTLRTDY